MMGTEHRRLGVFVVAMTVLLCGKTSAAPAGDTAATRWSWVDKPGRSLELVGPEGTVWRLNFHKDQPKVYFDPLGTVDGASLTWNQPPDHAWHYGLWFSWKKINGIDYWAVNPKTGKPAGETELREVKVAGADQDGATIEMQLVYHPAGKPSQVVMDEKMTLEIETPRSDGSYRIDWGLRTTARVDVILDRTPPPGQPGGNSSGGYGGLSFRGAKDLSDVVMTDSQGRTDMAVHRKTARWLDTSGTIGDKPVGVTFFDHPTNPRHPSPWFIVKDRLPHRPFTYMNPALLCDKPMNLAKGTTLRLDYRVLVHPGRANHEELESEFKRFASTNPKTLKQLSQQGDDTHER